MVWPRDASILYTVRTVDLLSGLYTHLDDWGHHLVFGHEHLGTLHHKPLTGDPLFAVGIVLGHERIEATLHSNDGLNVLTHGKLLQMIISLKHHFTQACACKPQRFEALFLPAHIIPTMTQAVVVEVQRKERLPPFTPSNFKCQLQVLHIDNGRWIRSLDKPHSTGITIQSYTAPTLSRLSRNSVHPPADVVLLSLRVLL
mmetsp:Transcript_46664/g.107839  ORF Transcript_46664/g.107839 Transcript_46664/m.107839 type:complete len:200 (-) Transcript_46664:627-1226(-)